MLEFLRLISNNMMGYASIVHPFLKNRKVGVTLGLFGASIRGQYGIQPSAPGYPFYNHGGAVYAHAPGRHDWIGGRWHRHATIASQRSGQAGGRIVTLNACSGATPCTT